ncbi:ectoine/hydroxyectoine ABC transporter permease subunit EhuC [Paraburkholderia aspalathi]|uniref:Amino acid ABC transporter membrane protein 1, PAAT family n=1 Tax=Paraburkholderia aspalathi TaxID=1324617 RepID=A0A1I7BEI1_9BURK|nr:ectoine/hydroxyectoine ABC transporter permease subunit EhuC [Paraburkholderia aspalathi]SFT85512.1 amino acid ABC transporter membrane protein 1, PAAT family [Paraburkholderia aspalathi]
MNSHDFLIKYAPRFVEGTITTFEQFFLATGVAVVLAMTAGVMLLTPSRIIRGTAIAYVELFRGTSLLVQLYWIFFAMPIVGPSLDKFTAGFIAVGLNLGAYGANLVKGAILAVPRGQWEASIAINMSLPRRMVRIIFPQALAIMLPAWGNLLIELLKATALVALISVTDLMFEVRQINNETFKSAEAFGTALIIYFVIARLLITPIMRRFEKLMAVKMGRG